MGIENSPVKQSLAYERHLGINNNFKRSGYPMEVLVSHCGIFLVEAYFETNGNRSYINSYSAYVHLMNPR